MVTTLMTLFAVATETYVLPKGLLSALCYVESTHNVRAINKDDGHGDSLGVCQIKLNTAKVLGFKGTSKELIKPKNNVLYAGAYLQKQLARYDNDIVKAVAAYNSGSFRGLASGEPRNKKYVEKVFAAWADEK